MSTESVSSDYDGPISQRIAGLLGDDRCRTALRVLATAPRPVPEGALALAVAVQTADEEPADVDDQARRMVHITLHHRDLPKLEGCGLVDRDVGERSVDVTDDGRELIRQVLGDGDDALPPISTGAGGERLPILVALSTLDAPAGLRSVADALVDGHEGWEDPESVATRLHHVDLPSLADAGLLSYDAEKGLVEFR